MSGVGRPPLRQRLEWAILALGALAASVLAGLALSPWIRPQSTGELSLFRAGRQVFEETLASYRTWLADPARMNSDSEMILTVDPQWLPQWLPDGEPPAVVALSPPDPGQRHNTDLLLEEAANLYFGQNDLERARDLALQAIAKAPDRYREAKARLRSLHLAAVAQDVEAVSAAWQQIRTRFSPQEWLQDQPVHLTAGLMALPVMAPKHQPGMRFQLCQDWLQGRMAFRFEPWQEEDLLRYENWAGLLAQDDLELRDRMIAKLHGLALHAWSRTYPPIPRQGEGPWLAFGSKGYLLLQRGESKWQARSWAAAELHQSLQDHFRKQAWLPDGFILSFEDGDQSPEVEISPPRSLPGLELPLRILHRNPEAFRRQAGRARRWLQGALVATAMLLFAASLVMARAIARQRQLQSLRAAFIATVSHELRTPLASMLAMAENWQNPRIEEKRKQRYPRLMLQETKRLKNLVEDILDYSRLSRGEGARLHQEEVSLSPWLAQLQQDLRNRLTAQGSGLQFQSQELPERWRLDPEAILRAVANLADNAVRHAGANPVVLNVELQQEQLCFTVLDRGPGIPAAKRQEVRQAFVQLHPERSQNRGIGMGLAVAEALAEGHGGALWLHNRSDGPGLEAQLRLPRGQPQPQTQSEVA
ncbi:MAG: sensor histidine kinase [Planctomycetota bacterium]|nr:MAG: sensor histidine kinase [Planctomycetota bacterium]